MLHKYEIENPAGVELGSLLQKMAGGEYLGFNNSIFLSERDSADRNNALAYFMRENHCFPPGDIKINDVLDFYFQVMSYTVWRPVYLRYQEV